MKLITVALTLQGLNISHLAEPNLDFKTSWHIKLHTKRVTTPIAIAAVHLIHKLYEIN